MKEDSLVLLHFVLAYAVGEAQAFPKSPAAFCIQTPSNFTWDWEGRTGPVPLRSSCEACASQGDGLTQYSAKMQDSRVFLLLAGTKLSACYWCLCSLLKLMPFPWHLWSSVPVPHSFGVKCTVGWKWEERQSWHMLCSPISVRDHSYHCSSYPQPRASLQMSAVSLHTQYLSVTPSTEHQA